MDETHVVDNPTAPGTSDGSEVNGIHEVTGSIPVSSTKSLQLLASYWSPAIRDSGEAEAAG